MRKAKQAHIIYLAVLASSLSFAGPVQAVTYSWIASSGNWTTTANWTPNADPSGTANTVAFLTAGSDATLDSNRTIGNIVFGRDADFSFNGNVTSRTLTLGSGVSAAAPTATGRTYSFSPNIDLAAANTWDIGANTTFIMSGVVKNTVGSQNLTKTGNGLLILTGNNSYTGATIIKGGTVQVSLVGNGATAGNLGITSASATDLVVNGGTLQFAGSSVTTNRLFSIGSGGATIDASAAGSTEFIDSGALGMNSQLGSRTLTLRGTNTNNNTLPSQINNDSSNNPTSLTKMDSGKWIISRGSSANGYTGNTTIGDGTLALVSTKVNPIASSLAIKVQSPGALDVSGITGTVGSFQLGSSQTLAGTGTVYGDVTSNNAGSKVMPGDTDTPGTLTLKNSLTLSAGTLAIESNGGAFSVLTVDGAVTLGGSPLLQASFRPPLHVPIVIINKTGTGAISNTFAGLAEGALFHPSSGAFSDDLYKASYFGGSGNDMTITPVAVPEPSSLIIGAFAIAGCTMRRRKALRNAPPK